MNADRPEQWREIKSLAADAPEQPEAERERWIRNACRDDSAKRAAVLHLLGFDDVLEESTATMECPQVAGRFSGRRLGPARYIGRWAPRGARGRPSKAVCGRRHGPRDPRSGRCWDGCNCDADEKGAEISGPAAGRRQQQTHNS